MKERFELRINQHDQYDIIDWLESREKNAICIYNDLGQHHYSSAPAVCDKFNELYEENIKLKWILCNYNPHDLDVPVDDKELKEFIDLLYSEKFNKELSKLGG